MRFPARDPETPMHKQTLAERPDGVPVKDATEIPRDVVEAGVTIGLRPRQRLSMSIDEEMVYVVTAGVLLLDSLPSPSGRQIVDLFYRGDVVRPKYAPLLPGMNLIASTRAEVVRIPWRKLEALSDASPVLREWLDRQLSRQAQRRLAHIAAIGVLTGEERLATLLIELALRVGEAGFEDSRSFDMALSRTDMADYLSLNADTLSRIMSRLRQQGVVGTSGRGRAYTSNFKALCARSPVAETIKSLHARTV